MSPAAILADLARRDIRLALAGDDRLAFDGPPDMAPADLDLIRQHKPVILQFLKRQGDAAPDAPQAREAERRPDPMPWLADIQVLDVVAFEERAAVLEFDAGLSRDEAEAGAARELGYVDLDAFADAVLASWRNAAASAPVPMRDAAHWQTLQRLALTFLATPAAFDAARAGWPAESLFGVELADAGAVLAVGAVFRQPGEGDLFAFDRDVALFRHADGGWHHRNRTEFDPTGAVALWEVAQGGATPADAQP